MRKLHILAICLAAASIAACGGGGSDEQEATPVAAVGNTPADQMNAEIINLCHPHGGYYDKTTMGSLSDTTKIVYEVRCFDGTKIVAGFDSQGRRV